MGTATERKMAAESADLLRKMIRPGDTVYTVLKHVARSGMSRRIDAVAVFNGRAHNISMLAADVLGWRYSDKGGIQVSGCGMDMGFHLVYSLSQDLYDEDGYALRHEWL